jgi:hypothetical protein
MRGLKHFTPQWNISINVISPHITETGMTSHCRPYFEDAGLPFQGADKVALGAVYFAQDENTMNGKCIDITQGRYLEVEDRIENTNRMVYGEDDFVPRTEKDRIAFRSTQTVEWE